GDDGARCAAFRLEEQAFAMYSLEDGPAHGEDLESAGLGDFGGPVGGGDPLQAHGDALVDDADHSGEAIPVRLDGFRVVLGRGKLAAPMRFALLHHAVQGGVEVAVDAADHLEREVFVGLEWGGAEEWCGGSGCRETTQNCE